MASTTAAHAHTSAPTSTRSRPTQPARATVSCRCLARLTAAPSGWRPAYSAQPACPALGSQGLGVAYRRSPFSSSPYPPQVRISTQPRMRMPPAQSFFGVGAPEAVLVGVVALIVFGPKGLADAAKSLGQTLRAFQPTIKEVVEVSQDIKGTLEKELGLDELRDAARIPITPKSPRTPGSLASMDDLTRSTNSVAGFAPVDSDEDPDIEAKRKASAAAAWGNQGAPVPVEPASEAPAAASPAPSVPATLTQPAPPVPAAPAAAALGTLSVEQLEAEIARRKAQQQAEQQNKA